MKYEDFKQLTPEQKEEYRFRFGEGVRLDCIGIHYWQAMFFSSVFCLMIIMLLVQLDTEYIHALSQKSIDCLNNTIPILTKFVFVYFIGMILLDLFILFKGIYQEAKWLKKIKQGGILK